MKKGSKVADVLNTFLTVTATASEVTTETITVKKQCEIDMCVCK
jgi:hypothetical protein